LYQNKATIAESSISNQDMVIAFFMSLSNKILCAFWLIVFGYVKVNKFYHVFSFNYLEPF
jgi:hypothetical protein